MDHFAEISGITLKEGNAVVLNAHEIEIAKEQVSGFSVLTEDYRGSQIFELNNEFPLEKELEFIQFEDFGRFYTIIDHFIIFSSKIKVLQKIVSAVQNSNTLNNNAQYIEIMNSLSSESSLLMVSNLPEQLKEKNQEVDNKLKKFKLAASQLVAEDNFSHVHAIISEPLADALNSGQVAQMASFKIDAPITGNPVFFKNHQTDQMDIAVQDINNTLYLLSNKGSIFWKKNHNFT